MLQQCGPNAAASSLPLVQGGGGAFRDWKWDLKLQLEFGFGFGLSFWDSLSGCKPGSRVAGRRKLPQLITENAFVCRIWPKSFVCIAHPIDAAPFPLHNPQATSATAATSGQLATCGVGHYLICIWLDLARNGNLPQNDDKAHWIKLANFSLLAIVRPSSHPVHQSIISGVTMSNWLFSKKNKKKKQNHKITTKYDQNLTISHNIFGLVSKGKKRKGKEGTAIW